MDVEKLFLKVGFSLNVYCSGLELDSPQLAGVECVEMQRLLFTAWLSSLPPGPPSRSPSSGPVLSLPPTFALNCCICLEDIKDRAQDSR